MAQDKSKAPEEALQVILGPESGDPFRDMLEFMVQKTLQFEMTERVGAKPYGRTEERGG